VSPDAPSIVISPRVGVHSVGIEEMSERIGLLFSDGSILVLPEGKSADEAKKEAEEHEAGDPSAHTQVLSIVLSDVKIIAG
jgi:hypothetical protein